ncbi:MAG: vitamin B12 dependent methionine synthase [Ruminococcaceae bacterium]|nr:vitamin B12 dependent-methionine synthase activation domain-containing protein [Anaerolineaceae bacterium]NLM79279.1 vitamin B12 dependent methionine synthase [Oscillospiraceae bacterium]
MQKTIQADIPFRLNLGLLLKKLKIDDDLQNEDYQSFCRMLKEAEQIARPKYVFAVAALEEKREEEILVEGHIFTSALLRRNLGESHRVLPYVATCGTEIDAWSRGYTDFLEQYWADEIKNQVLRQSIQHMRKTVQNKYFAKSDLSQMSPGSLADWPITQQKPLFALMSDLADAIGVKLTDSCLMIPSKSVSGFYFSAKNHFENCRLCPRENCPERRVPYEAASAEL